MYGELKTKIDDKQRTMDNGKWTLENEEEEKKRKRTKTQENSRR